MFALVLVISVLFILLAIFSTSLFARTPDHAQTPQSEPVLTVTESEDDSSLLYRFAHFLGYNKAKLTHRTEEEQSQLN